MPGFAEVYVEFKPTDEGGRRSPVWLNEGAEGRYMPHLCVHGGDGEYLGVEFVDGPDRMIAPGEGTYATVRFMYEPQVSYDALAVGVSFAVCEGGRVVGSGRITRR
jgi:translation elongation factor EF-Tu-like GTPase